MSNIYRLRTQNGDELWTPPSPLVRLRKTMGGAPHTLLPPEWRREMLATVIDASMPKAAVHMAPLLPEAYRSQTIVHVFQRVGDFPLPDIWVGDELPMVSRRAMAAIRDVDDFPHEFIPIEVHDEQGKRIDEGNYCVMNVRRRLLVEPTKPAMGSQEFGCSMPPFECEYLTTILKTPMLRGLAEGMPIWKGFAGNSVYLCASFIEHLRAKGVTGIDPYSDFYGEPLQSLVQVGKTPGPFAEQV